MIKISLLWAMLTIAGQCYAMEEAPLFHPLSAPGKSITLDAFKGKKAALLFWRSDCAPCLREIALLPQMAASAKDISIILVALEKTPKRALIPANLPPTVTLLTAAGEPENVLHRVGNTLKALPFSVALHADGTVCEKHYGMLGPHTLQHWSKLC